MRPRKLIYHIFPATILITIGAMLALIWYGSSTLQNFYIDETRVSLLARVHSIEEQVQQLLIEENYPVLNEFILRVARKTSSRITLVRPDGHVISDSLADPETMDDHKHRPEFLEAVANGQGSSMRFSKTTGEKMLYVAIPLYARGIKDKKNIDGMLRISVSVSKLEQTVSKVKKDMALAMVVVVIAAALATIYVSHRITEPLEEMTKGAERFAVGEFSPHLLPPDHVATEIAALSHALNSMADQLKDRIVTILHQRNELQTVLDSMLAAVLTVDSDNRLISLNSSASELLGIASKRSVGKSIQELIRNINLLQLIESAHNSGQAVEDEIEIVSNGDNLFLLANCVHLYDENKKSFGLLLVLHDVTRMRLLEKMRQDFVANVSHELKTPITSIKGYVETVLDDELKDKENSIRFLEITLTKANHLNAIIDHLLLLSRIEQEAEVEKIELHPEKLKPILEEAIHSCSPLAEEKQIALRLDCPDTLLVHTHIIFLEQAVVNLIVNAVRYSPEGSEILIRAKRKTAGEESLITIVVQDFGVGIGKEHLPRVFERFYRCDKARSRKLGDTGLGLAIVKHIAQAHGGSVNIKSEVGKGTSVFINLPG
ncbi:MAG: ATP-binding protein [Thermodesulfobacteriota bacterium]|nr:ATP-binding protein [Thermodesulfobacteriota bacterium]